MTITEWDFDVELKIARRESWEEGREEGREEGEAKERQKVIELIERGATLEDIKKILAM